MLDDLRIRSYAASTVLSREGVRALLEAPKNLGHRAILAAMCVQNQRIGSNQTESVGRRSRTPGDPGSRGQGQQGQAGHAGGTAARSAGRCRQSGAPAFAAHAFAAHAFATHAFDDGASLVVIQNPLGHGNSRQRTRSISAAGAPIESFRSHGATRIHAASKSSASPCIVNKSLRTEKVPNKF